MPEVISLTGPEVRLTAGNTTLTPYIAVDIADYDRLSFSILPTCFVTAGGSPSIHFEFWTGMQTDSSDGWVLITSTSVSSFDGRSIQLGPTAGFLRYITWRVSTFSQLSEVRFRILMTCSRRALAVP